MTNGEVIRRAIDQTSELAAIFENHKGDRKECFIQLIEVLSKAQLEDTIQGHHELVKFLSRMAALAAIIQLQGKDAILHLVTSAIFAQEGDESTATVVHPILGPIEVMRYPVNPQPEGESEDLRSRPDHGRVPNGEHP